MMAAANSICVAGQHILVTGASSGLGLHFARVLARHGAKVAVAARRLERLESLVKLLQADGAQDVVAVKMDVLDETSITNGVAKVEDKLGPIDVLVNNAGVSVDKPAVRQSKADWEKVIGTNLTGPFLVAQAVGKSMIRRKKGGRIINISSVAGQVASPGLSSYCASKAGLTHLTRVLALEWARYGIRVNGMAPGYFRTEMNSEFFDSTQGDKVIGSIPMRRLGDAKELDSLLLLLASERASSYMTGAIINIDGGLLNSKL